MIDEVRISDLGVIESASIRFDSGMTSLTGETGAGKTMTLTALDLLMGGKADPARVRVGAERASVEATFVVDQDSPAVAIVREAGGDVDVDADGKAAIIVSRTVPVSGRSRAYLGGRSVPAATLEQLAGLLVTVHGQADQRRLASASEQRQALDLYGGAELLEQRTRFEESWRSLVQARSALQDFKAQMAQAGTRRLALSALVKRVDGVKPRVGEDAELKAQAQRLANVEEIRQALVTAIGALAGEAGLGYGSGSDAAGAEDLLARAGNALNRTGDSELEQAASTLADVSSAVNDVRQNLAAQLDQLEADPALLESIYARRAELRAIEVELGMSVEEMLEAADEARAELASLKDPAARLAQLENEQGEHEREAMEAAKKLSAIRKREAKLLGSAVNQELVHLYMKDATFSVAVNKLDELGPHGLDRIEFQLAPHRGAKAMPLGRTASGGEMSRIMLSLEVALAARGAGSDQTFIFDEIDAGIGGKSALVVGERLARLASTSQVLCVTHLAQVAAYAARQIVVTKTSDEEGARTQVTDVQGSAREQELARMLSGHEDSDTARAHAAELLRGAGMAT